MDDKICFPDQEPSGDPIVDAIYTELQSFEHFVKAMSRVGITFTPAQIAKIKALPIHKQQRVIIEKLKTELTD